MVLSVVIFLLQNQTIVFASSEQADIQIPRHKKAASADNIAAIVNYCAILFMQSTSSIVKHHAKHAKCAWSPKNFDKKFDYLLLLVWSA